MLGIFYNPTLIKKGVRLLRRIADLPYSVRTKGARNSRRTPTCLEAGFKATDDGQGGN